MKTLSVSAIAIMTAVLTVPAYSQTASGRQIQRPAEPTVDPRKKQAEDKAYSDALSRIPTTKEYDPWATVREKEKPPAPPKKPAR